VTSVCGTNCVGGWENTSDPNGWGACDATCGYATRTRKYKVTTVQSGGGSSCPHQDGFTESQVCTGLPDCGSSEPCVGGWGTTNGNGAEDGWSTCSKGCKEAGQTSPPTQTRTYNIRNNPPYSTACPHTQGYTETRNCNDTPCCSLATSTAWVSGPVTNCKGENSSDPNPYIVEGRSITFPENTPVNVTSTSCNLDTVRYTHTAGPDTQGNKCPDNDPTSGSCPTGWTWSVDQKCHVSPDYGTITGGQCAFGNYTTFSGCSTVRPQTAGNVQPCPPGYSWVAPGTASLTGCVRTPDSDYIVSIGCPVGYTPDLVNNTCNALAPQPATDLQCAAANYFVKDLAKQKCVAR